MKLKELKKVLTMAGLTFSASAMMVGCAYGPAPEDRQNAQTATEVSTEELQQLGLLEDVLSETGEGV